MAATPATLFGTQMTLVTGNLGGAVQSLPGSNVVGGRQRQFIETITLATQVSGSIFGVARIPLSSVILGVWVCTSVSLGTATIQFGNAGNANNAIYGAAATLTTTDTPTRFIKTATYGVPITAGFDCVSGLATGFASSSGYGAIYEDIIMTTGVASLPGAGTLRIVTEYMID